MAENVKYYSWSNISHWDGDKLITIKPGTEVTQEGLGYDDAAWEELLEGGAVRPRPWPKGLNPDSVSSLSPNEHRLRTLRLQREQLEEEMAGVGGSSTQDDVASERAAASSGGNA
jgi:hypothetical protein